MDVPHLQEARFRECICIFYLCTGFFHHFCPMKEGGSHNFFSILGQSSSRAGLWLRLYSGLEGPRSVFSSISMIWLGEYRVVRVLLLHSGRFVWLSKGTMWMRDRTRIRVFWEAFLLFSTIGFLSSWRQTNLSERNIAPSCKLLFFIPQTFPVSEKDDKIWCFFGKASCYFEMATSDFILFHMICWWMRYLKIIIRFWYYHLTANIFVSYLLLGL